MRLDRNQRVCGFSIKTVRDFLRCRDGSFYLHEVCRKLDISEDQAYELIKELEFMGYIQKEGDLFWRATMKGCALCSANFLKPLKREKALQILDAFLGRVREINRNCSCWYYINYVGLFGSLEKGAEEVGDIDLAVRIILKPKSDGEIRGSPDEYNFRYNNILKFIRNRNPWISITTQDETHLNALGIFPRKLFP